MCGMCLSLCDLATGCVYFKVVVKNCIHVFVRLAPVGFLYGGAASVLWFSVVISDPLKVCSVVRQSNFSCMAI